MGKARSTGFAENHCPKCDYDVRGLTERRCPECGNILLEVDLAAYKARRWPPQTIFRTLIIATIPWFIAYVFVDAIHNTGDRIKVSWVTIPFLDVPLQFVLAWVAASALEAHLKRSMKRFGATLAVIVWILIFGHIAITVATL